MHTSLIFMGDRVVDPSEPETMTTPELYPTLKTGGSKTYMHSFTSISGQSSFTEVEFAYYRSWELRDPNVFPDLGNAANFVQVDIMAKDEFAHDIELTSMRDFDSVIPDELDVQAGDWIRFIINENPSTGYWWEHNAATDDNRELHDGGKVRELFNFYQAPQTQMMGASGTRVFVFEIHEGAQSLSIGMASARLGSNEDLPVKDIKFNMPQMLATKTDTIE
jgi:predicted secreted protein